MLIILWGTIAQRSKNRSTKFALGKMKPNMCEYGGKQPVIIGSLWFQYLVKKIFSEP